MLTPEELTELVRTGSADRLVAALAPLDQTQRRTLARTAIQLVREARQAERDAFHDVVSRLRFISSGEPAIRAAFARRGRAELAVLGLCAWGEARRASQRLWALANERGDHTERVLRDRGPDWLDKWIEQQLAADWSDWRTIRGMIRDGLCPRPGSDNYVVRMVSTYAGAGYRPTQPLAEVLRADRALLDCEVWRIFEVDPGRRTFLSSGDADRPGPQSWCGALIGLSRTGELDRQRLLTASLQALNRSLSAVNTGWFLRFHAQLAPTLEERIERQGLYFDLLVSTVPAVVGFALAGLKTIAAAGRLDVERCAGAIAAVFDLRQKGHVLAAVQLLKLAARHVPAAAGRIALSAARGLSHSNPDVQKACLGLIAALFTAPDPALAEALLSHAQTVAASQRSRLTDLLGRLQAAPLPSAAAAAPTPTTADPPPPAGPAGLDALAREAESLPPPWRALAGVDACLQALREGADPPPIAFDPLAVPRLDPAARVTPIATLDQLIEALYAAVEALDDADQLERLLDGLSRLGDQRPPDFAARTAPLLKRLNDLLGQHAFVAQSIDPETRLRVLVRAWLQAQDPPQPHPRAADWAPIDAFLAARMLALSARLRGGAAGPLLACPTHRGGWLDPGALVQRLHTWQQRPPTPGAITFDAPGLPDRFDFIQALLRLAPDQRPTALARAADLAGEVGSLVRFALGGAAPPVPAAPAGPAVPTGLWHTATRLLFSRASPSPAPVPAFPTSLWIAAARARNPRGDFTPLFPDAPDLGPDAAAPAAYAWCIDRRQTWNWSSQKVPCVRLTVSPPALEAAAQTDRPTVLLHRHHGHDYGADTALGIRSHAAVWPVNPDSGFGRGARAIVAALDAPASSWSPTAPYLEPLFDPDTPFTEMARLALCVALLSKDAGARGLAIDALIALIQDGRCTGPELGPLYARLCATKGMVRLNRLAEALSDVARVSPLHRHAATRLLESTLAALAPPPPADLHHLLTPLREWLAATGAALSPTARPLLTSITGSGKTAALAAALLALPANPTAPDQQAARALALRARLDRARRSSARSVASALPRSSLTTDL